MNLPNGLTHMCQYPIQGDAIDPCGNYRLFRDKKWNGNKKVAKYIIWCIEEDYMIVLEERERDAILITTYCVLYVNFSIDI